MYKALFIFSILCISSILSAQEKIESMEINEVSIVHKRVAPLRYTNISPATAYDVNGKFDTYVIDYTLLEAIKRDKPESLLLDIPIGKEIFQSVLHKVSVVTESSKLRTSTGTIKSLSEDIQTYRGKILSTNKSVVVTIANNRLYIIVNTNNGNYEISSVMDAKQYVGQYANELNRSSNWTCNTEDSQRQEESNIASTRSGDCIELYLECDYSIYVDNGSNLAATEAWVINMMNSVIMLYDDINIPLVVSEIFVWDTPDPYQSEGTLTSIKNAFMDEIQNNYNGRIAKLLSARKLGGGLADGIGGMCGSYGDFPGPYAISTSLKSSYATFPSFSHNIYVVAHEIGHVIGARHTHACVWNGDDTQIDDCGNVYANNNGQTPEGLVCFDAVNPILPANGGTVMSNCNLLPSTGIDFANGFHPIVAAELLSQYTNAECATGGICADIIPSNDDCDGAIELTPYDICNPAIFDNYLATASGATPNFNCGTTGSTVDVWFKVMVPSSGSITIESTDSGSLNDMIIQTYTGDCANLVTLACDDNSGSASHALVDLTGLTAGEYVFIRIIDSNSNDQGTFGLCAYDDSVACHPDFDALISIYNAANGSLWTDNTGWVDGAIGTDCNICEWYGVVCDAYGRVKELNLNSNNLSGSLSTAIGDLAHVKRINLWNHSMGSNIPNVFMGLDKLMYLDLSSGLFTGSIPDFSGLSNLQILYLENNMLTGELPAAIGNLPNINIYWVKNNNLSGCIPSSYISLCNIQSVQMQDNESLPSDGDFSLFCDQGLGIDDDGDGYCSGIDTDDDCNDDYDTAYPGATEICDGIDNDCNSMIDENFVSTNTWVGSNSQWNIASNWSLGHIPLVCEDVVVTSGNVLLTINDAVARSVTITNTGFIDIQGALLIQGSDGSSLISEVGSDVEISGTLEIFSLNGNAATIAGNVDNYGNVSIIHPVGLIHLEIIGNGTWDNNGVGSVELMTN